MSCFSEEQSTRIAALVKEIERLSDVEKLFLYLQLPCGKAELQAGELQPQSQSQRAGSRLSSGAGAAHSGPANNNNNNNNNSSSANSNTNHNKALCGANPGEQLFSKKPDQETTQTYTWILSHLEVDPNVSLPKQEVYDEYRAFCQSNRFEPLCVADFGKAMKHAFPCIKPRRLGQRGNSRYCYSGLRKRYKIQPPSLPDLIEPTFCMANDCSIAYNQIIRDCSDNPDECPLNFRPQVGLAAGAQLHRTPLSAPVCGEVMNLKMEPDRIEPHLAGPQIMSQSQDQLQHQNLQHHQQQQQQQHEHHQHQQQQQQHQHQHQHQQQHQQQQHHQQQQQQQQHVTQQDYTRHTLAPHHSGTQTPVGQASMRPAGETGPASAGSGHQPGTPDDDDYSHNYHNYHSIGSVTAELYRVQPASGEPGPSVAALCAAGPSLQLQQPQALQANSQHLQPVAPALVQLQVQQQQLNHNNNNNNNNQHQQHQLAQQHLPQQHYQQPQMHQQQHKHQRQVYASLSYYDSCESPFQSPASTPCPAAYLAGSAMSAASTSMAMAATAVADMHVDYYADCGPYHS